MSNLAPLKITQSGRSFPEPLSYPYVEKTVFLEHDRSRTDALIEREIPLDQFPSPQELWQRYQAWKGITEEEREIITQDYYADGSGKQPRYYQQIAINRTADSLSG